MTARTNRIAVLGTAVLLVAACTGGGGTASSTPTAAPSVAPSVAASVAPSAAASVAPSAAAATCDAVPFGIVTRCENFYEDYWPAINAKMDELYQEAKATEGGTVVIWDWYELSPDVINAFQTRFPGLTVKTAGFQGNTSAKIVTAKETGTETSDYLSGSLTSATPLLDGGFFDKVDWGSYGVPAEYLTIGPSELLPDSINAYLLNINTSKVPVADVPDSVPGFLDATWKDKLAMTSWNGQFFTGEGMLNGKESMQKLIGDLKGSNLTLTDDPGSLLSTGDKPVIFAGQVFNPNPDLAVKALADLPVWIQFGGVNAYGKNKAGAALYALWEAFDPDWLHSVLTQEQFATSSVPFPGLPSKNLDEATGLIKLNADAFYDAAKIGQWETADNYKQWNDLIKAADEIMYQ